MSNKQRFWEAGELMSEDVIRNEIASNVLLAYDHVFETGSLWFTCFEQNLCTFDFNDENLEFSKKFKLDDIQLLIDGDEQKEIAIKFLEALIEKVRNAN